MPRKYLDSTVLEGRIVLATQTPRTPGSFAARGGWTAFSRIQGFFYNSKERIQSGLRRNQVGSVAMDCWIRPELRFPNCQAGISQGSGRLSSRRECDADLAVSAHPRTR